MTTTEAYIEDYIKELRGIGLVKEADALEEKFIAARKKDDENLAAKAVDSNMNSKNYRYTDSFVMLGTAARKDSLAPLLLLGLSPNALKILMVLLVFCKGNYFAATKRDIMKIANIKSSDSYTKAFKELIDNKIILIRSKAAGRKSAIYQFNPLIIQCGKRDQDKDTMKFCNEFYKYNGIYEKLKAIRKTVSTKNSANVILGRLGPNLTPEGAESEKCTQHVNEICAI